jgi:Nif-specific regulatory protein
LAERFRVDLFYRLNVFPIYLPALRERGSDIILLADHFILKYSKEMGKNVKKISTSAVEAFLSHKWPGNVRELENCIERAVLVSNSDTIESVHLPPSLQAEEKEAQRKEQYKLSSVVEAQERALIIDALEETGGNQTKAAKILGTTKRIIQYKITKLDIDPKLFRKNNKNID